MKEIVVTSPRVTVPPRESSYVFLEKAAPLTFSLGVQSKLLVILSATTGWSDKPLLEFLLEGEGAEVLFLGFFSGTQQHHFSFRSAARHRGAHTKAHFYLRAIMNGEAQMDYEGNLVIEKSGQGADAYLSHKTLLLSEQARARTIPALEIEADDVKAGHNATIGKIDRETLFYALSRGIDEPTATKLFVDGFFEEQIAMITDPLLQEKVRASLLISHV